MINGTITGNISKIILTTTITSCVFLSILYSSLFYLVHRNFTSWIQIELTQELGNPEYAIFKKVDDRYWMVDMFRVRNKYGNIVIHESGYINTKYYFTHNFKLFSQYPIYRVFDKHIVVMSKNTTKITSIVKNYSGVFVSLYSHWSPFYQTCILGYDNQRNFHHE